MNNKKKTAIQTMNEYGKNKTPFLFIIDFNIKNPQVIKLENAAPSKILFNINGIRNYERITYPIKNFIFKKYPVSFTKYKKAFGNVIKEINAGNTYLLNLTFPTNIQTNLTLDEIFNSSLAKYKLFYKNKFVVFSPETFLKIENGLISSFPMKGTIDASIPNAKKKILSDKKEIAEHNTIVDLLRNDLNTVSKKVRVEKLRYIEKICTNEKTLYQVSSKITGELEKNYHEKIGEIIFSVLPAGSISGAPKKKTLEIIKRTENYSRGFYTGIFGYFDGYKLDSAVMIRFIENTRGKLIFKSGGGITCMSDAKSEYNELIDKVYVPII